MKFAPLLLLCKYCGELHDFIMVVDCYQGCCYYKLLTSMGKKVGHLSRVGIIIICIERCLTSKKHVIKPQLDSYKKHFWERLQLYAASLSFLVKLIETVFELLHHLGPTTQNREQSKIMYMLHCYK